MAKAEVEWPGCMMVRNVDFGLGRQAELVGVSGPDGRLAGSDFGLVERGIGE